MEPRLKSSIKWSPFPEELKKQISDVMTEAFEDFDLGGQFVADGILCPEEIVLSIGISKKNQLRQDNFEASIEFSGDADKATDKIHMLVDFLGQAWETFLDEEPDLEDVPKDWKEHRFEKSTIFLRYTSVNSNLEKLADELLSSDSKKLLYETEDEEGDVEANADTDADDHAHTCTNPDHIH